jgi:hypothetical protein
MPTFLVTSKMSPELRARVQASVQGRRAAPGARLKARSISLLRVSAVTLLVVTVWTAIALRARAVERLEAERRLLIERVERESLGLTERDRRIVDRVTTFLQAASGTYAGDTVDEALRTSGSLASVLARPSVYLRAPLASLAGADSLARAASVSFNDALVLCLLEPPAARTEKSLLSRAKSAYAGGERARAAAHVERLSDALVGLPYLSREWAAQVRSAENSFALERLDQRLSRAPLAGARRAAKAELLLFAIDEPGEAGVPAELDGERPHQVRIGVVDLTADKVLLRLRRKVDPSWISSNARAEFASGIDSCGLALDVHAAVSANSGHG